MPEVQQKIKESHENLKSLEFEYVQSVQAAGKVYFAKPNDIRIELYEPEKQTIIVSDKEVNIYTPRFKQVLRDSRKHWFESNQLFTGILGSSKDLARLEKEYNWELGSVEDVEGTPSLKIMLTKKSSETEAFQMWVGTSDFIPRKTVMGTSGLGVTTVLKSIKLNLGIDPALFKFALPEGAEIVDMP